MENIKKYEEVQVPVAMFNCRGSFNPYQYLPFQVVYKKIKSSEVWEKTGKNVLITDEVGVGKTFEAGILIQEQLRLKPEAKILILCPPKLAKNWMQEMEENFYIEFKEVEENLSFSDYLILPYSYLDKVDFEQFENIDLIIFDEVHVLRNSEGEKFKKAKEIILKNIEATRVLMTATPVFNSELDYNSLKILLKISGKDENNQDILEKKFKITRTLQGEANKYDYILDIELKKVKPNEGEQAIFDDLEEKLDDDRCKYNRHTGFLKRISTSSIHSLKLHLENIKDRKNIAAANLRYLQTQEYGIESGAESNLVADNEFKNEKNEMERLIEFLNEKEDLTEKLLENCKKVSAEEDTKLKEVKNILQNIKVDSNGKRRAIIFSTFNDTCEYLKEKLSEDYNIYTIMGSDSKDQVEANKVEFKKCESKEGSILICSDSAKEGHNLQFCQTLIHYDFPYTPAAIQQRNGRIYRKGQQGNPKVYYMFVEGSYDKRLYNEILMEKTLLLKELSKDLICDINILPINMVDKMGEFLNEYLEVDFTFERLSKLKGILENNDENATIYNYINNIIENNIEKYKAMKEDFKIDIDENIKEELKKKLEISFSGSDEEAIKANLKKFYTEKYDKTLKEINEFIFDDDNDIINNLDEYLKNNLSEKQFEIYKDSFCSYLLKQENARGSISSDDIKAYTGKFIPLMMIGDEVE